MPRRSINDEEIALIKALLKRKMPNKDIQFLFNRPDRSVNSGRISNIKDGSYSNSAEIEAASDEEVDCFLDAFEPTPIGSVSIPLAGQVNDPPTQSIGDPLLAMFRETENGSLQFLPGETDEHECKRSFRLRASDKWLRAIAALANNRGGFVVFGVLDPSANDATEDFFEGVGLTNDEFFQTDPSEILTRVKGALDPTPRFEVSKLTVAGRRFGFLEVFESRSKPVIVTKTDSTIKEGDILFRYVGQSSRIKYSDLRVIMDQRDVDARSRMVPVFTELARIGPDKALVGDLESGEIFDPNRPISIEPALLEQLRTARASSDPDAPKIVVTGEITQPSASGRVEFQSRNLLEEYPLSATEIYRETKRSLPEVNQSKVWKILKELKGNPSYSAYNFRNRRQEQQALATGLVSSSVSVIYNHAALTAVIRRLGPGDIGAPPVRG